jgi:hypothetical protein
MVMHGQGNFGPFRFGEVFGGVPGAEALAATFGTTPSGFFFDG